MLFLLLLLLLFSCVVRLSDRPVRRLVRCRDAQTAHMSLKIRSVLLFVLFGAKRCVIFLLLVGSVVCCDTLWRRGTKPREWSTAQRLPKRHSGTYDDCGGDCWISVALYQPGISAADLRGHQNTLRAQRFWFSVRLSLSFRC